MSFTLAEVPRYFFKDGGRGLDEDSVKKGVSTLLDKISQAHMQRFSLPLWSSETPRARLAHILQQEIPDTGKSDSLFMWFLNKITFMLPAFDVDEDAETSTPPARARDEIWLDLVYDMLEAYKGDGGGDGDNLDPDTEARVREVVDSLDSDLTDIADRIVNNVPDIEALKSRHKAGEAFRTGMIQRIMITINSELPRYVHELQSEFPGLRKFSYSLSHWNHQGINSLIGAVICHRIRAIFPYWKPVPGFNWDFKDIVDCMELNDAELMNIIEGALRNAIIVNEQAKTDWNYDVITMKED